MCPHYEAADRWSQAPLIIPARAVPVVPAIDLLQRLI